MNAATHAGTGRLAFARHGETAWTGRQYAGHSDLALTARGQSSAASLAAHVARLGLMEDPAAVIVASPLRRAVETARLVAEAVDRPVEIDPRWMEVSFGSVEGLTFEEAMLAWPEVANRLAAGDLEIDWPHGETWLALRERIAAALDDVRARATPVLVVGHGIAIRVALTMLAGPAVARESRPVLPAGGLVVARDTGDGWALETPEPEGGPA